MDAAVLYWLDWIGDLKDRRAALRTSAKGRCSMNFIAPQQRPGGTL
jgi:hypothetical protein